MLILSIAAGLEPEEFGITALFGHQLAVAALFDNFSLVQNHNLIGMADGGKAV